MSVQTTVTRYTIRTSTLVAVIAALMAVTSTAAHAQIQNTDQRACIIGLSRAGQKVVETHLKVLAKCVKAAARSTLPGADVVSCVDNSTKLQGALDRTLEVEAADCVADRPDFGYTSGEHVNEMAMAYQELLIGDVFGDLNASVVLESASKADAKCQGAIIKGYAKILRERLGAFNYCKAEVLRSGDAVSADDLEGCFDMAAQDPKGKIEKARVKLFKDFITRCDLDVLDSLFPGNCSTAPDVLACIDQSIRCRACVMLNRTDSLHRDCDLFDNDDFDGACFDPSANECEQENVDGPPCDVNATCTDTDLEPGFLCECNAGWNGDGLTCADDNECIGEGSGNNCDANATCTNTDSSFECACNDGWEGDGVTCTNIDECTLETDNCDVNATCTDSPGSFTCECNAGYNGDGVTCVDDDECVGEGSGNNCDANASCTNTDGSFECACNAGYTGDGVSCTDDNECAGEGGGNNCSTNATCTNTPGSFSCACNAGYSGNGVTCVDVDECSTNTDNCHAQATCTNTIGSFTCACNAGWHGSGVSCVDDNECTGEGSGNNCSANGSCTNTPGSFSCSCNNGYTGDGVTCSDINECQLGTDNCNVNATCANTQGSFTCTCNSGWLGNGVTCNDANECFGQAGGNDCAIDATCTNTPGSYTCECRDGFYGDPHGVACDLMQVALTSPTHGIFTQSSTVNVTGTVTASPLSAYTLRINGSVVSIAPNGTFSTTVNLSAPLIYNPIQADLTENDSGFRVSDRRVVIVGPSVSTAVELPQSVGLRINDSGFTALAPILTGLVDLDLATLLPPGTVVVDENCGGFLANCLDKAEIHPIHGNYGGPPSIGGFTLAINSIGNDDVRGTIVLSNLRVDLHLHLKVLGVSTTCDNLRLTAASANIVGSYAMRPLPTDRNVIDVNQNGDVAVTFASFNQEQLCGGIGFVNFVLGLNGSVEGSIRDGLVSYLRDPDGTGAQDAVVAQAIEDALADVELTGPIGDGFGIDLQTPLFDIPEDAYGITLASGAVAQPLNPNGLGGTVPWQFSATLNPVSSYPTNQLKSPNTPGGQAYDMGLVLSEGAFNRILAALVSRGDLDIDISEIDLLGTGNPLPITPALLSTVVPEFALHPNPGAQLTIQIRPTLAPAITGATPPTGELGQLALSHLLVNITENPGQPNEMIWGSLAADFGSVFDLVVQGNSLVPVIGAPSEDDIDVVLLANPLGANAASVESVLPPLLVGAFEDSFSSLLPAFGLPSFLGVQPAPLAVEPIGDFYGVFLEVQ